MSILSTLHGILAELGIEPPAMHPARNIPIHDGPEWVINQDNKDFSPVPGALYELAFGKLRIDGQYRPVIKRIRTGSERAEDWIDLDEGRPLNQDLRSRTVKAYRRVA